MVQQQHPNLTWVPSEVREGYTGTRPLEELVQEYYLKRVLTETDAHQLHLRLERGDRSFVFLDVRPAEGYAAGHLPGAISMPYSEIEHRYRELLDRPEIVAYCWNQT